VSLFDWFAARRKDQFVGKVSQETDESDGLWVKCSECSQVVYRKDLISNQNVCNKCGHHNRINSSERINNISESQRDQMIHYISSKKVGVNVHYIPMPMLTLFKIRNCKSPGLKPSSRRLLATSDCSFICNPLVLCFVFCFHISICF